MIAVLCVCPGSFYRSVPCCDIYDMARPVSSFTGGVTPVIAHPPCRHFGKLRAMAKGDREEDMETAKACVRWVRECGGVLEHPARSVLWDLMDLPKPGKGRDGSFTLAIWQSWFGHRAQKATWLYVHGVLMRDVPPMPFGLLDAKARTVEQLCKSERDRTPPALVRWLVDLASQSRAVI